MRTLYQAARPSTRWEFFENGQLLFEINTADYALAVFCRELHFLSLLLIESKYYAKEERCGGECQLYVFLKKGTKFGVLRL